MGSTANKLFLPLAGRPILWRTLERLSRETEIQEIVLVAREEEIALWEEQDLRAAFPLLSRIVPGGETRTASVRAGLTAIDPAADWVAIHDGARPLVSSGELKRLWATRETGRAAILAVAMTETVKQDTALSGDDSATDLPIMVERTIPREHLWLAQTPQLFAREVIAEAYRNPAATLVSDDAALVESLGVPVILVAGSKQNIKITTPEDLALAQLIWHQQEGERMRIGTGYDLHRLIAGRELILCGVNIPFDKGLLGHSDADVATHALCDAILGALAIGDLGHHFPESDAQYAGINSLILLELCRQMMSEAGFFVGNADITIIAQAPRLATYRLEMRKQIARVLDCSIGQISIKATTAEGLDAVGRHEGIAAQAMVLLYPMAIRGGDRDAT